MLKTKELTVEEPSIAGGTGALQKPTRVTAAMSKVLKHHQAGGETKEAAGCFLWGALER